MDNSTLNISIHICIYERRVDPKVPGSNPTVSRNLAVHYLLQSSILLLEITICLHITLNLPYISENISMQVHVQLCVRYFNCFTKYLCSSEYILLFTKEQCINLCCKQTFICNNKFNNNNYSIIYIYNIIIYIRKHIQNYIQKVRNWEGKGLRGTKPVSMPLFFMHFFISSTHCSLGTASTEGQYIMPLYWLCPVSAVLNCPYFLHVLRRTLQVRFRTGAGAAEERLAPRACGAAPSTGPCEVTGPSMNS